MNDVKQLRILEVAKGLFHQYGFQKVTMGEIAEGVGISRPTLYQSFANKEEIFTALIDGMHADMLERIVAGRKPRSSVRDQLKAALDVWTVEPYQFIRSSPQAAEFQNTNWSFAQEALDRGNARFEAVVRKILTEGRVSSKLKPGPLAHLIQVAAKGFKTQARDLRELRGLLEGLITLVTR